MVINPETVNVEELEAAEKAVDSKKYEALTRLLENEDFKTVVLDGYLKDEAARITSLLAVPSEQQFRSQMFEGLAAISHFEYYLQTLTILGAPENTDDESEE